MIECQYLGHMLGHGHNRLEQAKLTVIQKFAVSMRKKVIWSFLGMAGYYRKVITSYSTMAAPLTNLDQVGSSRLVEVGGIISGTL